MITVLPMSISTKTLILALLAAFGAAAAVAADPPKSPWKAGWDRKNIKVFAYACTDGIQGKAQREYEANVAARVDRVTVQKPFPEKEFRDSAFPMCLCISERVAETWALSEMANKPKNWSQPFIDEALNGGRCKPQGLLGEVASQRKQAR